MLELKKKNRSIHLASIIVVTSYRHDVLYIRNIALHCNIMTFNRLVKRLRYITL